MTAIDKILEADRLLRSAAYDLEEMDARQTGDRPTKLYRMSAHDLLQWTGPGGHFLHIAEHLPEWKTYRRAEGRRGQSGRRRPTP